MTNEQAAEKLLSSLVGESTCLGVIVLDGDDGPHRDPNRWRPRHTMGKSYSIILEAIRAAVADERDRVLSAVASACVSETPAEIADRLRRELS
jgi:hypothetical protein